MKPPAFQFYADDFSAGVRDMTTEDVGAYILLLCYQWSKGQIPADKLIVDRVAGCIVSEAVMAKFPGGKNARMEAEREKQVAYREMCAAAGRAGGGNPAFERGKPNPYYHSEDKGEDKGGISQKDKGRDKGGHKGRDKGKINSPSPSPSPSPISDSVSVSDSDSMRDSTPQPSLLASNPPNGISNVSKDGNKPLPDDAGQLFPNETSPDTLQQTKPLKTKPSDNDDHARKPKFTIPTLDSCRLLAAKAGIPESEGDKFFHYYASQGWRVGKNPMRSAEHAFGGWAARYRERCFGGNGGSAGQGRPPGNHTELTAKTIGAFERHVRLAQDSRSRGAAGESDGSGSGSVVP